MTLKEMLETGSYPGMVGNLEVLRRKVYPVTSFTNKDYFCLYSQAQGAFFAGPYRTIEEATQHANKENLRLAECERIRLTYVNKS